ncbi:MAG: pitrilysin family protein [Bacteroidota bacterium]
MIYQFHTLSNGIRIAHKQIRSNVSHLGVAINSGTRDELENESGLAHFIEHTIFKGTTKRKSFQVLSRLENVGGDLNAYTTKEETYFYASFLKSDYIRSAELLSDILFNSTFPEKELNNEKDVVIEEINSYKDSPSELIYDEFENQVFANHPMGRNILGTIKSVKKLNRNLITQFINRTYTHDQIFISSVSNLSFEKVIYILEKHFAINQQTTRQYARTPFNNYNPTQKKINLNSHQSHCLIGIPAYHLFEEKRIPFSLLNNVMGGPGMNTRLNIAIREKHGYAYTVESQFNPMTDTGLFTIYIGSDHSTIDKSIDLTYKELHRIKTERLGTLQLSRAKKQFFGQISLMNESNQNEMLSMAKSGMYMNRIDTMNDIYTKINNITADDILNVANEIIKEDQFSTLIYTKVR